MKRRLWIGLGSFVLAAGLFAQRVERRVEWVRIDPATGEKTLIDGTKLPDTLTPGSFLRRGRDGSWQQRREWRPPMDIEIKRAGGNAGRVVFSHERHFAALTNKTCAACHADAFGLGKPTKRASLSKDPALEPHGETSLGRYCANCHRPDGKTAAFTQFGKTGAETCGHCHAPANHGADFTAHHGDRAEHGARECAQCHRGAAQIKPVELAQARRFRDAQLVLVKNPDDKQAFSATLPNNFCAYCHGIDAKPWHGEGDERERRRESGRQREGGDD